MDLKAFELIETGLQEELAKQGFSQAQPLEDEAGKLVMFSAADVAYGLLYDVKHQRFELRSTTLKEDGQPGAWRSLSLWLFDEKEGTKADAESILNDFLEVVRGPKRVAVVQQKRRGKEGGALGRPPVLCQPPGEHLPRAAGRAQRGEDCLRPGALRHLHQGPRGAPLRGLGPEIPRQRPHEEAGSLFDDMYKNGDLDTPFHRHHQPAQLFVGQRLPGVHPGAWAKSCKRT